MRFLFLAAAVLVTGCYDPHLSDPGFFCHVGDDPACPDGQVCVNGRCQTEGVGVGGGGGDSGSPGNGTEDMSMSDENPDLAHMSMQDMKHPKDFSTPPDLTMCVANGGSCPNMNNAICCSGYCRYSDSTCITHP